MSVVSPRFIACEKLRPLSTNSGCVRFRKGRRSVAITARRTKTQNTTPRKMSCASLLSPELKDSLQDTSITPSKDQRLLSILTAAGLVWLMSGSFATGIAEEFNQYSGSVKEEPGRSTITSDVRVLNQRGFLIPAPFLANSTLAEAPPSASQLDVQEALQDVDIKATIESLGDYTGLLKYVGIFLAGGLVGSLLFKGKDQTETETALRKDLLTQKTALSKFEEEVESWREAILKEQKLVSELKQQRANDQKISAEQIKLLEEEKQSILRKIQETEKALEDEKQLIEATRDEVIKASKASDSESTEKQSTKMELAKLKEERASFEQKIIELESEQSELAVNYLKKMETASELQEKAEQQSASLQAALTQEHEKLAALKIEFESKQVSLEDRTKTVKLLEEQLTAAQKEAQHLHSQISILQEQYGNQSAELEAEKQRFQRAEDRAQSLRKKAEDLYDQLAPSRASLESEKEEVKNLKSEIEAIKKQYSETSDQSKEKLKKAQNITVELSEQINKLTLEQQEVERRANALASQLEEANKISKEMKEQLKVEERISVEAMKERDQLQEVVTALKKEAKAAQGAIKELKTQLQTKSTEQKSDERLIEEPKAKSTEEKAKPVTKRKKRNVNT